MLIPVIARRKGDQLNRNILALPEWSGEASREYALSIKVTTPLVEQIVSQSHQASEYSLVKSSQQKEVKS